MKYQITINQAGVVASGLHQSTDIVDWAIVDYLSGIRPSGQQWFRVNYPALIDNLPLARLTTKSAVSRRITKLQSLGLIEIGHNDADNALWASFTDLAREIVL